MKISLEHVSQTDGWQQLCPGCGGVYCLYWEHMTPGTLHTLTTVVIFLKQHMHSNWWFACCFSWFSDINDFFGNKCTLVHDSLLT